MADAQLISELPRVECDENCGAPTPESLQELSRRTNHRWALLLKHGKKARIHWQFHSYLKGCSHGS